MAATHSAGTAGTVAPGGNMYPHTSTRTLLAMNAQYLREYRANPTAANLAAVENTSRELSRRGA